jgi:hypothetical protein
LGYLEDNKLDNLFLLLVSVLIGAIVAKLGKNREEGIITGALTMIMLQGITYLLL